MVKSRLIWDLPTPTPASPDAELQISHTPLPELCTTNQSSEHSLYYRTQTNGGTGITRRVLFSSWGMCTFVTLMAREQRFLHLTLPWKLTSASGVESLPCPHLEENFWRLLQQMHFLSHWRLLGRKCGHTLILQETVSSKVSTSTFHTLKSNHTANTCRGQRKGFLTHQYPIFGGGGAGYVLMYGCRTEVDVMCPP